MSTTTVDTRVEEQKQIASKMETITKDIENFFKPFTEQEFLDANEPSERVEKLFAAFAEFKETNDKIEYIADKGAVKSLKFILANIFETLPKSVNETDRYIGLFNAIDSAKKEITFNQEQLQYIGEMFSKGSFTSIEEANQYKTVQDDLRMIFGELYVNQKALQMASQAVQSIENQYKMIGLEKEEEIITEDKEETVAE